jgi:hypothetical protein
VAYHITRSEQAIRPLHTSADNPAIPPVYYVCRSFIPRSSNDHRNLDRILDRVTEPVEIEMTVEPADITEERFQHSVYMARLQSINRLHGYDEEESVQSDPFEPDRYHRVGRATVIQPLRRRDPIADDILAEHRRFHENLGEPHLAFSLRVAARTPAVARLIASVLAESAFEDGSYRLWPSDGAPNPSGQHPASASHGNAVTPPTLDLVLEKHATAYRAFGRFAHVATVDELLSALVLPVATRGGPRCMRKNTEPPIVPCEQLLIFGHDE